MRSIAMARRSFLRALQLAGVMAVVMLVALAVLALPARLRIPPLAPHPAGAPAAAAAFSHVGHASMPCYMCHPSVFPQALQGFTHREMGQGRYCGACHSGVGAIAIEKMTCSGCHAEP
jgi:c(7)-type cytochrome triheme protein